MTRSRIVGVRTVVRRLAGPIAQSKPELRGSSVGASIQGGRLVAESVNTRARWLKGWRERRRDRRQRRVDAHKVTQAARGNKDDAARWSGPMR
jgi:hypothetical protein